MKEPKEEPRHGVVVARVSSIQEPEDLLVDEVEPEKPTVGPGLAGHCKVKNWRIADGGHDMPGHGYGQKQENPWCWSEAQPGPAREQAPSHCNVYECDSYRE